MHIFKINILHLNQKLKFLEMGITDYDYILLFKTKLFDEDLK